MKVVTRSMMKLGLAVCTSIAMAGTPVLDAKYVDGLSKVNASVQQISIEYDACKTLNPATDHANALGLASWKKTNAAFLNEYAKRYDNYLRSLSAGDNKKYGQFKVIMDGKRGEALMIRRAALSRAGHAQIVQDCTQFPKRLQTELNPQQNHAADVALTRQLVPMH